MTNSRSSRSAESVKASGLEEMLEFVCRGECEDTSIEDLCKKLEEDDDEGGDRYQPSHKHSHSSTNKD